MCGSFLLWREFWSEKSVWKKLYKINNQGLRTWIFYGLYKTNPYLSSSQGKFHALDQKDYEIENSLAILVARRMSSDAYETFLLLQINR